jgi:ribosomal peptide maturation radical SAM protein 1
MDAVFAVMPFADIGRPALGVSLLAAEARAAGFSVAIEYCNITLAEIIGPELYHRVAGSFPPDLLIGEWFFADDVFGDSIPDQGDYLEKILIRVIGPESTLAEELTVARKARARYLDDCVQAVLALSPAVVGFTTTFHQTCACLAVARRLKQLAVPPVIVFGGANCEGEMGAQMLRSFPWIDYVCCGESDRSFVALLEGLLRRREAPSIPGVLDRQNCSELARSEVVRDLNQLPTPEFDDYFSRLASSSLHSKVEGQLVLETSRGCWWGAKHHCTFCGLNGDTMTFRSKSPERAFEEMEFLSRRHQTRRFGCVDNILDLRYIDTLFPRLAESGLDLDLFYEVKANLRYDQLVTMRRAGVRAIQPGIESLSNEVLRLMDKGCTAFQNIQLLRWCQELGIEAAWNILAGFPGEPPAEYEKMAKLVPLLTHLAPPCSCAQVRLDRFSPFHVRSESYGFRRLRPARAYFFVFPLDRRDMDRLAYFFDFDYEDARQPAAYLQPLEREIQLWWKSWSAVDQKPTLDARFDNGKVTIVDTRPAARTSRHELTGLAAKVFARCDVATTVLALCRHPDVGCDAAAVINALASLCEDGLIVERDGQYLSLPVFRDRPLSSPSDPIHAFTTVSQATAAEPLLRLV